MWLVGFTVSLSAFYTVRSTDSGDVRITYAQQSAVRQLAGDRHIGVLPSAKVQFAGAANSPVDVTVSWDFRMKEPCMPPVFDANFSKPDFDKVVAGGFDPATATLSVPDDAVLDIWKGKCTGSQQWILTATSNQDHSKWLRYDVTFCRTINDCPEAPTTTVLPTSTTGGAGAGGHHAAVPARPAIAEHQKKAKVPTRQENDAVAPH
jgi:hypothetical protein